MLDSALESSPCSTKRTPRRRVDTSQVLRAELMWPSWLGDTWAVTADSYDLDDLGRPRHYVYLTEETTGDATSVFRPKEGDLEKLTGKVNNASVALQAANTVIFEQVRLLESLPLLLTQPCLAYHVSSPALHAAGLSLLGADAQ